MASKEIEEFVKRLRKQGYRMEVTPETATHNSSNVGTKKSSRSDSFLGYTAERTWDNFKDVFKNIHKNAQINASAGYGEDVLKQLDKLKESSTGKGWNKKGIEQLEQAFLPSIEQTRKEKDERGIEEIKRVQQNQNELDENIEQKYSGLAENQKKWGNRIASIGSVLPSALAYAVPGGQAVSAGVTFGNISGDAIGNALLEGKTPREAQSYGYLEGLKEAAVEQAFGGVAGLSKKAGLSKGLNALLDNKVSNKAARTLLSRTGAATGEGLEEVVSTLAEPLVRKAAFNDEELQNVSLDDLKESFLGGSTAAAILGTGQDAINSVRNKRSITKIANQTGRTKEEVKNSLNNFNTVEARDVIKALDPADFEPKLSTIENMQRYAKEIDDVFTGKAKDGSFIELGETPAILQRLGAKPHKLTMTQDTARKIAYPEGYEIGGKSMGGKHNLGIPALKQLPAQLENPLAILKSKTQPNSFVVLTNWKLDDGRTVITPIHLDKQGNITIDNRVVSTYGKDVNKLLGENGENILWRKNDRSIDQLLVERLQLPMASSDDASSIYNMPQDENYVNSGDVTIKQKKTDSISHPSDKVNRRNKPRSLSEEQVNPSSIDYDIQQDGNYVNNSSEGNSVPYNNVSQNNNYINDDAPGAGMGERRTTKRILNDESNLVFDDPQMQSEFYDEINNAKNVYYEKVSTKDATEKALSEIEQRGIEGAANLFYKNLGTSKRGKERAENLILGVELAKAYTNAGDVDGASNIISEIMPITTDAAQVMSLTKALYKLGGRGVLKSIQSDLARINKQRGTEIEIDETLANRLAGAKTEPEIQAAAQAIEADLKQRIPVKLHEKLGALRRISMLANPKTQVRNLVGNAAMNLMGRMSSAIDGMLQRMLIRDPNLRTNTIFKRRSPEYSNARTFAKEYFKANKEAISGDSRYDSRTARLLRDRDTFKNKAMRFVEQKTNRVMEWGDAIFTGNAFQRHFANEVVARKLSMEDLKNPANRQQLEQIINQVALKAQKETFRDESRLANSITSLKNRLNNSKNPLAKAAGAWIDGVIPFTKTPINVTKRAIEYSPLGVIKTVYQGIESRGTPMAKANFISSLSQNLTGTAMAGLGYMLAQNGLIRVGGDDKEEYYESDQGRQRYSLEIGDTSISLDWLSPAAMPFFMGAVWSETDGADSIDDVFAAGQQIFGPLMEMSMMSSADDMITNIRKSDTNIEAIAEALIYTPFESYILQYFPTIGSQLNQVIDPTRRTTYTNADSEVLGRLEKTGRKALNKLPGANLLLENMGLKDVANAPYVNAWGEKQVNNGNVLERVFNSFVNPAYVNEIKSDVVDREIERLYNSNVEDSKYIIPTTSFGTVTNGGNEYKMTTTEVTNHRQTRGQMSKRILRSLINNSAYRSASDEDKIKMIKDVYKYAEYRADTKMLEGRGKTYNINESDWRKKVDYLDAAGVSPTTYFLAHNARSNATGQYTLNQWGERESIEGSVKKAQVNAINGYGMTAAQKLLFLYLETPSYSYGKEYSGMSNDQARKVVANYVAGLNIPYEEKVKILKRAGYHIKNGYAYWD